MGIQLEDKNSRTEVATDETVTEQRKGSSYKAAAVKEPLENIYYFNAYLRKKHPDLKVSGKKLSITVENDRNLIEHFKARTGDKLETALTYFAEDNLVFMYNPGIGEHADIRYWNPKLRSEEGELESAGWQNFNIHNEDPLLQEISEACDPLFFNFDELDEDERKAVRQEVGEICTAMLIPHLVFSFEAAAGTKKTYKLRG